MKRSRILSVIMAAAVSMSALTAVSTSVSAEWVKTSAGYSYKSDTTGKKLTGWQTIGKSKYYFDKKGVALTGWKKIGGKTYYFNASKKGKMLTSWAKVGGKQYYFGSDGVMLTGLKKINGKTYYFGDNGVMRTGKVSINGKSYTFGSDGVLKSSSTSASSSSAKLKLEDAMGGLYFGMTKSQMIKKLPYDTYFTYNSMIAAKTADEDVIAVYALDADGRFCAYGFMNENGKKSVAYMEKIFEDSDWEFVGESEGQKIYLSPEKDSMGIAFNNNDGACALVYSSDILSEYIGGNTSALDHLVG